MAPRPSRTAARRVAARSQAAGTSLENQSSGAPEPAAAAASSDLPQRRTSARVATSSKAQTPSTVPAQRHTGRNGGQGHASDPEFAAPIASGTTRSGKKPLLESDTRSASVPTVQKRKRAPSTIAAGAGSSGNNRADTVVGADQDRVAPKKAKAADLRSKETTKTVMSAAPKIDISVPDSPERPSLTTHQQKQSATRLKTKERTDATIEDREERLNDDGEDTTNISSRVDDDPEQQSADEYDILSREAVSRITMEDLSAEAVTILPSRTPASSDTDTGQEQSPLVRHGTPSCSRGASLDIPPSEATGPPTTDEEDGQLDGIRDAGYASDVSDSRSVAYRSKSVAQIAPSRDSGVSEKVKGKRALKLQQEAPTVSAPPIHKGTIRADRVEEASDSTPWLSRTDISTGLKKVSRNTWTVNISSVREPMSSVMRRAIHLAELYFVFGLPGNADDAATPPYTAFQVNGPSQLAIDALIDAAVELGYDKEHDVAHRLEDGSESRYINPLCNYVASRLRTYRGHLKDAAASVVPIALRFTSTPLSDLQVLAADDNFLYPRTTSGSFDYTRPFGCDALCEVLRAAFFTPKQYHDLGLRAFDRFKSSSANAPDELEIPPTMLALAATALEAVLADRVNQMTGDFATSMNSPYLEHLATAIDYRTKKPGPYHELTHRLYRLVSEGHSSTTHARQGTRGRARVDWDNIAD
ncbi:hypothetical protein PYCCODRAFT_1481116 [Trametes coccinea BRFM310]|uniref:DUF6532 domain-containing protein n=1 Tax=Trametes coccinea (strain BRFM310) TaxID=1353009 RepID=A0A1Y2IAK8_TRAC3|nr:hypothetical protein PYCCODRAFT_1481116 [Trametes coccinea BRFM310]